jgi:diguanylate cyclase (GGDEF)-like protein
MTEDALDARVRDDALRQVVANLMPLQVMLLPLALLIAVVMRHDVDRTRLAAWLAICIAGTLVGALTHHRVVRCERVDLRSVTVARLSLALVGAAAGFSTWVAAASAADVETLFAMLPAVALAVGAVVCAGRRDTFLAYASPLTALAATGLAGADDLRMRALGLLFVLYGVSQVVLHHTVSRSYLSSLRLQVRSQSVALRMANDQIALTDAYQQLSVTNAKLAHLAAHDQLTGLLNRRGTLDSLDSLLAACTHERPVALLFCDLDRFKAVNDLLGHRGGDQFISVLADRIARSLDDGCIAGRIGGDEFVMMLPDHDIARAAAVAARLVSVLAQPVHAEGRSVPSAVSIGVACAPHHGRTTGDLLRNANAALYRAKHSGRNRVELFDGEMQHELDRVIDAEHSLRRAIDDGEVLPFFQPEIDATTGRVVGAELLARWLRPDGTMATASEFIAVAHQAGLLERLTECVMIHARPDIRRLASLGLPDGFRFRINLAPASTDGSWRHNPIDALLFGIDPSLMTVDVREAAVLDDLPAAAAALAAFRARGGRVCLDDFAHGVSSLSLLRKLPVDEVRIDRQRIDTITSHPHDRAIVRSIISVVHEIGLTVTSQGVESGAHADSLIALGCVRQQGHLYAPALPPEQFEAFVLERQAAGLALRAEHDWRFDDFGPDDLGELG